MDGPVQTVASPGANRRASQGKSAGSDGRRGVARVRRGCGASFGRAGGEEGNGRLGRGWGSSSARTSSGGSTGSVRSASTVIDGPIREPLHRPGRSKAAGGEALTRAKEGKVSGRMIFAFQPRGAERLAGEKELANKKPPIA